MGHNGCEGCKYEFQNEHLEPCFHCNGTKDGDRYKKQTNADRIRAMTDKELAEFLSEVKHDGIYYKEGQEYPMIPEIWKEWLQSEMEE